MTLDIRGSLKNTRLSSNPLVVIDELLSNAIDAYLIRRSAQKDCEPLKVDISVELIAVDLLDQDFDLMIKCSDNGTGLGSQQLDAFLTKDTSYKDDLSVPGITQCKGSGRIQFFHHFSTVNIESIVETETELVSVSLPALENRKSISQSDFVIETSSAKSLGTTIRLTGLTPKVKGRFFTKQEVYKLFGANALKQHMLFSYLQRFVALKSELGDFKISIATKLSGVQEEESLLRSDIPNHETKKVLTVKHDGPAGEITTQLVASHYRLSEKTHRIPRNLIALCARNAIVRNITGRYLKPLSVEANPIEGFYHIVLIEGDLLDSAVNEQRDGFEGIPEDDSRGELFDGPGYTMEEIYNAIDEVINDLVAPPDWARDKIVSEVADRFGLSEQMLTETETRVRVGDTPESVATRVLHKIQRKVVQDTNRIYNLKSEIAVLEPDTDEFRRRVDDLACQYAYAVKTIDMANLSQLVIRRAALVDVLELAVGKKLKIQIDKAPKDRSKNEALIHSVFFPMRRDSEGLAAREHDVWLLSEDYHYYDYITSDQPLAKIKIDSNSMLFDPDIDAELQALYEQRTKDKSARRPDIALFHKEGSVVIIEFKAPGVDLDLHEGDLMEYAQLLAAKSGGRLTRFYGYLIGDSINELRLSGFNPLPGAKGYFRTVDMKEPKKRSVIGQLYTELLYYEDIVDRAKKRIKVYRDRLNLPN